MVCNLLPFTESKKYNTHTHNLDFTDLPVNIQQQAYFRGHVFDIIMRDNITATLQQPPYTFFQMTGSSLIMREMSGIFADGNDQDM